jgi:hypothetical protein
LNAMDAMPSGGVLALATSSGEGSVIIEIADTGSGLTPEECERLFTPYYTTKQHGTGLGLAVVQSVISDHGGTISVESESGVGTTFRIVLMIRPAVETEKNAAAGASGDSLSQAQARVPVAAPVAVAAAAVAAVPVLESEGAGNGAHAEAFADARPRDAESAELHEGRGDGVVDVRADDAAANSREAITTSEPEA